MKQVGSVLVFNPVPEDKAIDKNLVQGWIKSSVNKAKKNFIGGKELTPYLIDEINKLSKNKTLEANKVLIINNAALAGRLAANFNQN